MPAIGSQISRQDYNNLQRIVYNVLGPGGTNPTTNLPDPTYGYGQTLASSEIGPGDQTITEAQWDQLRTDINKAYTHQVGSVSTIPDVAGSTSAGATNATRITFGQVYQTYLAAANDILTNKNLFAGSQKPQIPVNVATPKFTTTPWSVAVSQLIQVTFNSAAEARAFFNSGATINFKSQRTGGTLAPINAAAQNNSWTEFLNNIGQAGTVSFGQAQFYALTSGGLAENAAPVFLFMAPSPYSNNYYRIKANCNAASNTNGTATFISFFVEWIDSTVIPGVATDYIDGTLTSIISETKSVGVTSVNSPTLYTIGDLSPSGTAINLSPSFTLTASPTSINEGGTVTFTFTSRNYPAGKAYQLEISGVTDSQLSGSTIGIKNLSTTGNSSLASFTYPVTIRADLTTNPGTILNARVTVSSDNFQAGEILNAPVTVNDTSVTPTPSVDITSTVANTIQGESIDVASPSTVTLTNNGSRVLNVSNITINRGASLSEVSSDFTGMSGAPTFSATTIAVSQSKTFTVKFAGSIVGTQTAVVIVTSDGNTVAGGGPVPGTAKTANISVTVVAATFGVTTSPALAYTTSFASDGITPGSTANQTIRITNSTGNATITLGSPAITVSGQGLLEPTITGSLNGSTIAPGSFREFQIRFTGLAVPSTNSPTISIDCGTAGTKTITATVTGTQSQPQISVSTTSLVAASKTVNVETTSSFTITNSGSASLAVSNIAISGQNSYSDYIVNPSTMTVPVGATQSVIVTSKRSRIGTNTATITITSNAPNPNNSKTVSFSMTSTGFTSLAYYITAAGPQGYTGNDPNIVARVNRSSTMQSYVTGAEPNATAYVYHKQANGVVSGVPAGTTPAAAFASKLLPRTSDSQGKVDFWQAGDRTDAWDIGTSQVFAWIPIGKLDDGTQQYFSGATDGNLYRMETFPNLTLTVSSTSLQFPNTGLITTWPNITYILAGGYQNQQLTLAPTTVRWDEQTQTPNGNWDSATVSADGTFSRTVGAPEPGVWSIVFEQTYKGVAYRSNSVTITSTSAPFYPYQPQGPTPNSATSIVDMVSSVKSANVAVVEYTSLPPMATPYTYAPSINPDGSKVLVFGSGVTPAGAQTRTATTPTPINLSQRTTLNFYANRGTESDWGQDPEDGENLRLEYSTNGSNWILLTGVNSGNTTPANTWRLYSVTIPSGAKISSGVFLRFAQSTNGAAARRDTWAMTYNFSYDSVSSPSSAQTSLILDSITWVPNAYGSTTPATPDVYYKWWRTVNGLTPNKTYTIQVWGDDIGSVGINWNFLTGSPVTLVDWTIVGPTTKTFTTPPSGRVRLIIQLVNRPGGPTFQTNPGWVSVQILDGESKVWGTTQATAAGY